MCSLLDFSSYESEVSLGAYLSLKCYISYIPRTNLPMRGAIYAYVIIGIRYMHMLLNYLCTYILYIIHLYDFVDDQICKGLTGKYSRSHAVVRHR